MYNIISYNILQKKFGWRANLIKKKNLTIAAIVSFCKMINRAKEREKTQQKLEKERSERHEEKKISIRSNEGR